MKSSRSYSSRSLHLVKILLGSIAAFTLASCRVEGPTGPTDDCQLELADGFETGDLTGWARSSSADELVIVSGGANGTGSAFRFRDGNNDGSTATKEYFSTSTEVCGVSWYWKHTGSGNPVSGVYLLDGSGNRAVGVGYDTRVGGVAGQFGGADWELVTTSNVGEFFKVEVRFDWNEHTIDLYVDDMLERADVPFADVGFDGLTQVQVQEGHNNTVYLDEVMISDYTAPPSQCMLALADGFENGTLTGWTRSSSNDELVIVSGGANGTGHTLRFRDGNNDGSTATKEYFSTSTEVCGVSWYWKHTGSGNPVSGVYLLDGSGNRAVGVGYDTRVGGVAGQFGGADWELVTTFNMDEFFKVEVRFDWNAHAIDLFVNDMLERSEIPFADAAFGGFLKLQAQEGHNNTVYLDEVRVSGAATPF